MAAARTRRPRPTPLGEEEGTDEQREQPKDEHPEATAKLAEAELEQASGGGSSGSTLPMDTVS